jgi:hypothetical protein
MAKSLSGHVLISYSRRDEAVMRRVVMFLRNQGLTVWMDNDRLVPGTPIWEEEIEKAIKGAEAIVVLMSPDSKNSEWVRREISYADQYHKRIFPVLVRGDEDSSVTLRLITRQFVDLRENEETGLGRLSTSLTNYLGQIASAESQGAKDAEELASEQTSNEPFIKSGKSGAVERPKHVSGKTLNSQRPTQRVSFLTLAVIGVFGLCGISTGVWGLYYLLDLVGSNTPENSFTEAPATEVLATATIVMVTDIPTTIPTFLPPTNTNIPFAPTAAPPIIGLIDLPQTIICDGRRYDFPIYFQDSDGDAHLIIWQLIYSKKNTTLSSTPREFVIDSQTQKDGAIFNDWIEWSTPGDEVQIRVYITDGGGLTAWKDFEFRCSN